MRSRSIAGAALTLSGIATFAGMAMPAFAADSAISTSQPQASISVSPSVVAPGGTVSVAAECRGNTPGGDAKTATFYGTTLGLPARIPMTASSTEGGVFYVSVPLPAGIMPGTYSPSVDCSNGMTGAATLTVKAATVKPNVVVPTGVPVTGDGVTSTATGGPLTAVGAGLLGVSGLAGAIAIRRRKANAAK
jgi:hypothetical protein